MSFLGRVHRVTPQKNLTGGCKQTAKHAIYKRSLESCAVPLESWMKGKHECTFKRNKLKSTFKRYEQHNKIIRTFNLHQARVTAARIPFGNARRGAAFRTIRSLQAITGSGR